MTKLSKLHARLKRLRRRRRMLRWTTGYSGVLNALGWILIGAFVLDWQLALNRPQRIVLLAICAGLIIWAFRRWTRPWLGAHESELDVALMVERLEHIDTDLVAALQFESPDAPNWGSVQLEEAVIENTARLSSRLHVSEGIPRKPLARRTKLFLATAVLLAAGIGFFPEYAATFLDRMLLGSQHYPTATRIETIAINGRTVDPQAGPHPVVEGDPLRMAVTCSGELPEAGRAELKVIGGSGGTTLTLEPTDADRTVYTGTLARLSEPVRYQVFLGDAWTDPAEVMLVPLPTVQVSLEVTPPDYASGPEATRGVFTGLRQVAVVEGSKVRIRIAADKVLRKATLSLGEKDDQKDFPMVHQTSSEGPGDRWVLESGDTPLAAVVEPVRYSVQVTDEHGLQLEKPVQGVIRIKPDRIPRVTASILTDYILPTAHPTVVYEVWDDYGVSQVSLLREVVHEDGRTDQDEVTVYQLAAGAKPETIKREVHRMDLSGLKLTKGDQLRVTVRGVDYRGPRPGKAGFSEPMVFQVTDMAGILAAISEADKQSARELKEMIRRQIGVGEKP